MIRAQYPTEFDLQRLLAEHYAYFGRHLGEESMTLMSRAWMRRLGRYPLAGIEEAFRLALASTDRSPQSIGGILRLIPQKFTEPARERLAPAEEERRWHERFGVYFLPDVDDDGPRHRVYAHDEARWLGLASEADIPHARCPREGCGCAPVEVMLGDPLTVAGMFVRPRRWVWSHVQQQRKLIPLSRR